MMTKRAVTQTTMTGLYLLLAILLEVAGTTAMKFSDGFQHLTPSVLIFVFYLFSFLFLTLTLRRLEVSLVYALWSGVGTLLITAIGVIFFHEPATLIKLSSLACIVVGIIGLRLG
jgi:small multidrug resistance pump